MVVDFEHFIATSNGILRHDPSSHVVLTRISRQLFTVFLNKKCLFGWWLWILITFFLGESGIPINHRSFFRRHRNETMGISRLPGSHRAHLRYDDWHLPQPLRGGCPWVAGLQCSLVGWAHPRQLYIHVWCMYIEDRFVEMIFCTKYSFKCILKDGWNDDRVWWHEKPIYAESTCTYIKHCWALVYPSIMTSWQKLLDYATTAEVSPFPVLNVLFQCPYIYISIRLITIHHIYICIHLHRHSHM